MMYWIYDYPSLAIAVAFCTVFVVLTWGGIFLTRATIHSWIHREARANEMIGFALSSFFVLFGLLLGLLAVATYQNYANVGDIVDKEASSIGALYRDFTGYPQPIRGQLQVRLREYARYTIEDGWPRQRLGIVPAGGSARIDGRADEHHLDLDTGHGDTCAYDPRSGPRVHSRCRDLPYRRARQSLSRQSERWPGFDRARL
jgi:hypothetical protein